MTVYVVSQHCEGSGGFDWFWTSADADEAFDREVESWSTPRGTGQESTIRLVAYEAEYLPARDDQQGRDNLTAEIDANLDLIEIELPAIREAKVS